MLRIEVGIKFIHLMKKFVLFFILVISSVPYTLHNAQAHESNARTPSSEIYSTIYLVSGSYDISTTARCKNTPQRAHYINSMNYDIQAQNIHRLIDQFVGNDDMRYRSINNFSLTACYADSKQLICDKVPKPKFRHTVCSVHCACAQTRFIAEK